MAVSLTGGLAPASAAEVEPKLITYSLDRQATTLPTHGATVGEALAEHSISVDSQDSVTPSLSEPVAEGETVAVVFAKRYKLKVGQQPLRRLEKPAVTVQDALTEAGVRLGAHDRVRPRLTTELVPGARIEVDRVSYKRVVKPHFLRYKTVSKPAPKLYKGTRKVLKQGRKGKERLTFERKRVNGEVVSTKRVKRVLVRKPVSRVVLVGTKERPTATLSGVWRALAQCESGGNPRIVSSNGLYHGLFQFSVGTWHSVGGAGLPSQASVAEQLKRAKILQARSGWGQWPHCSSALGLR